MEGDSRNPRVSLLKKFDIPVEHLSYEYVEKCFNKKELEKIIRILRSGEEGFYPDLLKHAEDHLRSIAPESKILRVETPILNKDCLSKEEWDTVEKELMSWEEEMNIMDKSLHFEKGRAAITGNKNLPEVRNMVKMQSNKDNIKIDKTIPIVESCNKKTQNNNRIKSGDYSAWDKFDVEKELMKLDVEEEKKQEEGERKKREAKKLVKNKKIELVDVDKENYSFMEQQVLANQAKDRGNECYKANDLDNALKYYEISIKLYPTANAYNNRALTYLKLKQFEKTIEDCNKVLQIDKNNIKALHRRATAYQNLPNKKNGDDNDQLALQDLYELVQLEPNNKVAQADLQKLKNKLNIQNTGKKFRMPISEDFCSKLNSYQAEEKNINSDDPSHKLPLTYYGPSTSTFQCERFSMLHRVLSGSSIPGQILCKCNSNRTKQNPLCQKCGEAVCTPKPRNIVETEKKIKNCTNEETITKNKVNKIVQSSDDIKENETENNVKDETIQKDKIAKLSVPKNKEDENKGNEIKVEELKASDLVPKNFNDTTSTNTGSNSSNMTVPNTNSKLTDDILQAAKTNKKEIKHSSMKTIENNDFPNQINKTFKNNSSQHCDKSKKSKSKTIEKSSKENKTLRKHLEPLKLEPTKVVYAAKYLHPTSAEPKIKTEPANDCQKPQSRSDNVQFKNFIPNTKCYSSELSIKQVKTVAPLSRHKILCNSLETLNKDLSLEGNKENNLDNSNVEISEKKGCPKEKEFIESAYEFMKCWEESKSVDESYTKRAEIIKKIRPGDLSKVIGVQLNSDMLSCLLECLLRHFVETDPDTVIELLRCFPQIPRFGLVSMFLAESDKNNMKTLIEKTERKGFNLSEDEKKKLILS